VRDAGKKHDLLFEQLRALAVNHPAACPYCHAETGRICVNKKTGELLVNVPAHYARIKIAGYPDVEDSKC
jgi:hypothetical protein